MYSLKPLTVTMLIGAVLCVSVWSVPFVDEPQAFSPQNPSPSQQIKTLRDMAQDGDVEKVSTYCLGEFSDLSSLSKSATTIVAGRITGADAAFSEDGHDIITKYSVAVDQTLKAKAPVSTPLEFLGFGGVAHVNGHRAVHKIKGYDKLIMGKRHVFFLEWIPRGNYYILAGGVSGLFSIDESLNVHSLSSDSNSELRVRHSGLDLSAFLNEVNLKK